MRLAVAVLCACCHSLSLTGRSKQFGARQGSLRQLVDASQGDVEARVAMSTAAALVQVAEANNGRAIAVISNAAVAPVLGLHLVIFCFLYAIMNDCSLQSSVERNAPHLLRVYVVVAMDLPTYTMCVKWTKQAPQWQAGASATNGSRRELTCSLEDATKV